MLKYIILSLIVFSSGCSGYNKKKGASEEIKVVNEMIAKENDLMKDFEIGTYGYDKNFLMNHDHPVELKNGNSRLLVSQKYQGRVMTSSSEGYEGKSYGWINHELIASEDVLEQFNPVGGEERFWLGPEGGQYSLFFKPGSTFDFENWFTPACIDTEPFNNFHTTDSSVVFNQPMKVANYQNFEFQFDLTRKVELLAKKTIDKKLGITLPETVNWVGYETTNIIKNTGKQDWKKETGLVSIWLLGMFIPSPSVTMILPYKTDAVSEYIVKDDYFGKVPGSRLKIADGIIYFKGDGKQRGKIGIPPQRAKPVIGSYDSSNRILTIVKAEVPEGVTEYVNSAWEHQKDPYSGDAINAYNDGPLGNGGQLGPFYELESSSPALALKSGSSGSYIQSTYHFEGEEADLDAICNQIFNISLDEIKSAFQY